MLETTMPEGQTLERGKRAARARGMYNILWYFQKNKGFRINLGCDFFFNNVVQNRVIYVGKKAQGLNHDAEFFCRRQIKKIVI